MDGKFIKEGSDITQNNTTIKVKRGPKEGIPEDLNMGEPVWAIDSKELYIGDGEGGFSPVCKCVSNSKIGGVVLSQGKWGSYNHIFIIPLEVPDGYSVIPTLIFGASYGMDTGRKYGSTSDFTMNYCGTGDVCPMLVLKDGICPSSEWTKLYYQIELEYVKIP